MTKNDLFSWRFVGMSPLSRQNGVEQEAASHGPMRPCGAISTAPHRADFNWLVNWVDRPCGILSYPNVSFHTPTPKQTVVGFNSLRLTDTDMEWCTRSSSTLINIRKFKMEIFFYSKYKNISNFKISFRRKNNCDKDIYSWKDLGGHGGNCPVSLEKLRKCRYKFYQFYNYTYKTMKFRPS